MFLRGRGRGLENDTPMHNMLGDTVSAGGGCKHNPMPKATTIFIIF